MSRRPQLREPEVNTTYLLGQAYLALNRRITAGVVAAGHAILIHATPTRAAGGVASGRAGTAAAACLSRPFS